MNKILRYSFVALMAIIAVYAKASVSTLNFTAACGGTGTASDGAVWTVTSDGAESTFDNNKGIHYGTSKKAVQYIKLSTDKINGTITKIMVNASTANGVTATADVTVDGAAFGGDAQTISSTATDYTFTGSASGAILVTITKPSSANGALYVKSIEVTYTPAAGSVSKPEFSVASGMFFEAQSVALTCETEGAKILYTLDGSDPAYTDAENYTGVFYDGNALTISKTTTIKAMAVKDGNKSDIVSAAYTIIITEAKGTAESPFSVADGLTVVNALDDNATSPKIFIKGYIVGDITISSGQASFNIADAADATENLITVFRAKGLKNDNFAEGDAKAGDVVVINAPLQKYVKTLSEECETVIPETQYGYIYSINGKTEFDPINFEGDGTEAKPYTIADLKQMRASIYPTDAVWVKGIIVGAIKDNKLVTTEIETASNIAIAATSAETEYANIVPVELKAETDIKTALNVVDNPTNIGKEVLLQGKIKTYFSVTGVKDLEAYKLNAAESETQGQSWDFTQWSEETVANLKADAAASSATGWSDIEKADATEPTDISKDNCFWFAGTVNEDGSLSANGVVIKELKGLKFDSDYATKRSLAIAVNYPSTTLGDYAGGAYLWLGGGGSKQTCPCFTIPGVKAGSKITVELESHKPSDGRGIGLYKNSYAAENLIGEQFKPTTKDTKSWDITEDCDVVVWNTSGCHIYTIKVEAGASNISTVKVAAQNGVRYNLAGQKVDNSYKGVVIVNGKKMLQK